MNRPGHGSARAPIISPLVLTIALAALFIVALLFIEAIWFDAALVDAATPDPSTAPVGLTGDPRSDGGGPGIVGSPLAILLGVVMLGLTTVLVTLALSRLSQRD